MLKQLKTFVLNTGKRPGHLSEYRAADAPDIRIIETVVRPQGVTEAEISIKDLKEKPSALKEGELRWIRVIGVHDTSVLETLGTAWGLSRLQLEDIANTVHRPKIEHNEKQIFIIAKLLGSGVRGTEQPDHLAYLMTDAGLLTFEEREIELYDHVRNRIKERPEIYIERGVGYLLYALLDTAVDSAFGLVEGTARSLLALEQQLAQRVHRAELLSAYQLRRNLILMRQWMLPTREVVRSLSKGELPMISKPVQIFMADILDHIEQLLDAEEVHDRLAEAMINTHISASGQQSGEVMQTLTVIATIFIPLTFIAGVYGMNFHFMPELSWHYGYFGVLGVMLAVVGGMLFYFRSKHWF